MNIVDYLHSLRVKESDGKGLVRHVDEMIQDYVRVPRIRHLHRHSEVGNEQSLYELRNSQRIGVLTVAVGELLQSY